MEIDLTISYDEEGGKFLCSLFQQMLQDKWDAERAPPKPLYEGTKVFVNTSMVQQVVLF